MRYLLVMMCVCMISSPYARDFNAVGDGYGYSFSDVSGWVGIGQDAQRFPEADMVFLAADLTGGDVKIRHLYTDLYMFVNVTKGTPDEFLKQIEKVYKVGSPNLKIENSKDIGISGASKARVTYILNITEDNKAQAVASIPRKGYFVSLIMQAKSEILLRENLPDFEKLLKTYKTKNGH